MGFCGKCGFENPVGARFCGRCGEALEVVNEVVATPVAQPVITPAPVAAQPVAPAATPVQPATGATPPYTPTPQKKKGGFGKTCLGCGCALLVVTLIAVGIGVWYSYKYVKDHEKELGEVLELIDKNVEEKPVEHAEEQTYQGRPVKELAEELGFPFVTYNERPKEGVAYVNEEIGVEMQFTITEYKDGEGLGKVRLMQKDAAPAEVRFSPCGSSIYHVRDNAAVNGYFFVEQGANRVLFGTNDGAPIEFTLK